MNQAVIEVRLGEGRSSGELDFVIEAGAAAILSAGSNPVLDELLERIFGLEAFSGSEVLLAGGSLVRCRERVLLGRLGALGYASAEGGLIANLKVWENLLLPRHARSGPVPGESIADMEQQIIEAFAEASIDEPRTVGLMARAPDRLSAFERIVCALARCHLSGFRLLVCDRIFDRLDEGRTRRVAALIDWLGRQHGGSALLVLRHSARPVEHSFGLRAWSPVHCIQLEEKSWLAS